MKSFIFLFFFFLNHTVYSQPPVNTLTEAEESVDNSHSRAVQKATFLDLHLDVYPLILRHLNPSDINNLASTCKHVKGMVANFYVFLSNITELTHGVDVLANHRYLATHMPQLEAYFERNPEQKLIVDFAGAEKISDFLPQDTHVRHLVLTDTGQSVKTITTALLCGYKNIVSVTLKDLGSLEKIGCNFCADSSVQEIEFSSLPIIKRLVPGVISNCPNLKKVVLNNMPNLNAIYHFFGKNCHHLEEIQLLNLPILVKVGNDFANNKKEGLHIALTALPLLKTVSVSFREVCLSEGNTLSGNVNVAKMLM